MTAPGTPYALIFEHGHHAQVHTLHSLVTRIGNAPVILIEPVTVRLHWDRDQAVRWAVACAEHVLGLARIGDAAAALDTAVLRDALDAAHAWTRGAHELDLDTLAAAVEQLETTCVPLAGAPTAPTPALDAARLVACATRLALSVATVRERPAWQAAAAARQAVEAAALASDQDPEAAVARELDWQANALWTALR